MSVLILGAGSRIAAEIAARYGERGETVVLAAHKAEDAELIAKDLKVRYGCEAYGMAFDALNFDSHPGFIAQVEEKAGDLSVAVVAFGVMGVQSESESDFNKAHKVIDTNYTGAVSVTESIAARMQERGEGTIIGISSVAGDRGRQSNYMYGSAKGAFTLYLQGLRNRLFKCGVSVLTVKLGFVDTKMTYGLKTKIPVASPEAVSRAVVKAADRKQELLYYPQFWKGVMGLIIHMPEALFKRLSL